MKKKGIFLILITIMALVFLNLSGWGQEEEQKPGLTPPVVKIGTPAGKKELAKFHVGLRLHGGLGWVSGGDINPGLSGMIDTWSTTQFYMYVPSGEYQPLHAGLNGGLDVLAYLGSNWGITLGTEFLQAKKTSEVQFNQGSEYFVIGFAPKVSAIPIKLGLFFEKPLGEKLSLSFHGGAGYYLGRFHFELNQSGPEGWMKLAADTKANNIGFHGGAALELKLSKKFFFFVEALGRYARLDGFSGTATTTSDDEPTISNSVIIYFMHTNTADGRFHFLFPGSTVPDNPAFSDIREAMVDFSGFSARAGLRIRF